MRNLRGRASLVRRRTAGVNRGGRIEDPVPVDRIPTTSRSGERIDRRGDDAIDDLVVREAQADQHGFSILEADSADLDLDRAVHVPQEVPDLGQIAIASDFGQPPCEYTATATTDLPARTTFRRFSGSC